MKKILLINTKYRIEGGEDSNINQEILDLKKNFKVELLEFDNKKLEIMDIVSFFIGSNITSNRILNKKLDEFNPDYAYIHNTWFKAGLGIFKVLIKKNIPVYLKLHNFRYDCTKSFSALSHLKGLEQCPKCGFTRNKGYFFNKYFTDSYLKSFFIILYGKKYIKYVKRYTKKVLVLTNFHKERLIYDQMAPSQVIVSVNPFNLDISGTDFYNPNSKFILYAGMLSDSKGVEELIEAYLNSNLVDVNLKIIGSGPKEDYLKNKYNNQKIEFLGQIDNKTTLNYILSSRCIVTATKMYEGQPRLLTEASYLGVPSIFPKFGGMGEFFPKNYELVFNQYDYEDLTKKINLLDNAEYLVDVSKDVKKHIQDVLNLYNKQKVNLFL